MCVAETGPRLHTLQPSPPVTPAHTNVSDWGRHRPVVRTLAGSLEKDGRDSYIPTSLSRGEAPSRKGFHAFGTQLAADRSEPAWYRRGLTQSDPVRIQVFRDAHFPGGHVWVSVSARPLLRLAGCSGPGGNGMALTGSVCVRTLDSTSPPPMPTLVAPFKAPRARGLCASFLASLLLAACASTPTPPYRDYEIRGLPANAGLGTDTTLTSRLRSAVVAAGWETAPSLSPGVVTTAPRSLSGGLTQTTATLDLVPVNANEAPARFVRVVVRAERRGLLGGRSKVYALDGGLRERLLAPITEALAAHGLVALGAPRDRDEDVTGE